jgi:two-component system phosphate regulon response regulator PhoB
MAKKRIILVEDERDMAELVAMRLKREFYEVEVVHDGREALDRIRCNPPDLVLLDIMLPGISGTEVLRALRDDPRTSAVPVVMLTARTEDADVVVGLQLGADDYVTKPFSMPVLIARISTVLHRNEFKIAGKNVLSFGPIVIDPERHRVEVDSEAVDLTATEFRLLVAIVAARGRVLNRNQLIDQALGMDAVVTDRTIDVHMAGLRRKLGKARNCIATVRGVGYRLTDEQDGNVET